MKTTKHAIIKELAFECESGNGPIAFSDEDLKRWEPHFPNLVKSIRQLQMLDNTIVGWTEQYWSRGCEDENYDEEQDTGEDIEDLSDDVPFKE